MLADDQVKGAEAESLFKGVQQMTSCATQRVVDVPQPGAIARPAPWASTSKPR